MLLTSLALLAAVNSVNCFNFEVRDPVVKKGPAGSYFGYSVAEHITDNNQKWLLVGAPLGQNLQPNTNHSGALFKCPVDTRNKNDCEQIDTDGHRVATGQYKSSEFDYDEGHEDTNQELSPPGPDEIKDGQWLGVAVKSQGKGGMVMVCAHRYITGANLSQTQHGLGLCYSLRTNLEWDSNWEPCKGRPTASEHQQYGYCQAGTSLAFLPDGTALIGSPGPYTWRGTMFVVTVAGDFLSRDKTFYLGPLNDQPEPIDKYSYLGMSVSAGKFDKNEYTYVAGAPRSHHHGQVYLFKKQSNTDIMDIKLKINGTQFASNFGYEILTTDVNNDGYDDLFVAAPFYFNKSLGGAVYIYYNIRNCINEMCKHDLELFGPQESRFGFSMTALGDINHDGYADIAVGAPYDKPNGAIYIYLGGKDGLHRTPSQIIRVEGVTTLGYSLSGGMDMDDNSYTDLLTGSYDSDMIVLFKTRSIVHIDIEVTGDELRNIDSSRSGCRRDRNNQRTCFSFEVCIRLKWPIKYTNEITVKSTIEGDIDKRKGKFARISFNSTDSDKPNIERYIKLSRDRTKTVKNCYWQTVYLKENNRDILSPIKFNVTYQLSDDTILSPILNQTSVKTFRATFQKDCGSDETCQSQMIVSAGLQLEKNPDDEKDVYNFNLGSLEELNVEVNVTNEGESAYEAQLFVIHDITLSYIALNDKLSDIKCTYFNDTLVTCTLGNPFQKEKPVNLGLRFEIIKDTNKINNIKQLNFHVFVNSTSEELSDQTSAKFVVEVKKKAEVKIKGGVSRAFVTYGGSVKGESAIQHFDEIGQRVGHLYQVINDGPWSIEGLLVEIEWPIQIASSRPQGKWLLYLEKLPIVEYDGASHDRCFIKPPFKANELNYTERIGSNEVPEKFSMPPVDLNTEMPSFANLRRNRRDLGYAERTACMDDKRNCTLDCSTAKCAVIVCELPRLSKGSEATIYITSRLWNSTLLEEFSKQESVKIVSRARIVIPDPNVEQDTSNDADKAETTVFPETAAQSAPVPLWIIIISILAGILFFIFIVFCLYKCGFFKRNRVKDPKNSADVRKSGESKGLLSTQT